MKKTFIALSVLLIAFLGSCTSLRCDKKIADNLSQSIKDQGIEGVEVAATDRGVMLTAGNLNFPADSASITPETAERLDKIAGLLAAYKSSRILVEGHTADVGDKASQVSLSKERAQAVADYLTGKEAIIKENTLIEGAGGSKPVAPNDTDAGKAKNRRVEITLLR